MASVICGYVTNSHGEYKWYYRMYDSNNNDLTKYFKSYGKLVNLKTGQWLSAPYTPEVLYSTLQKMSFKCIHELENAQREIDRCNKKAGCSTYCSKSNQEVCDKIRKHNKYLAVQNSVNEIVFAGFSCWSKVLQ